MFESLVETFTSNPYLGVAIVFLICGLGFPLPEEIVLVAAGYVCFKGYADVPTMVATAAAAILAGDLLPFVAGRTFGSRLLRVWPLRALVTRERLAIFDRWFRRRGELVIFFARFVPGIRIVAYFTAGTMRMRWARFMLLDGSGIALGVPLFVWVGARFGHVIDEAVARVRQIEHGLVVLAVAAGAVLFIWWFLRRRSMRRALLEGPSEAFVGPSAPARDAPGSERSEGGATDGATPPDRPPAP